MKRQAGRQTGRHPTYTAFPAGRSAAALALALAPLPRGQRSLLFTVKASYLGGKSAMEGNGERRSARKRRGTESQQQASKRALRALRGHAMHTRTGATHVTTRRPHPVSLMPAPFPALCLHPPV